MRAFGLIAGLAVLAACTPPTPPTLQQVEAKCSQEARAAAGPTGQVTVGASSSNGLRSGISIGVTDDFLRGREPAVVYAECYTRLSGAAPLTPYSPTATR
ncbi:MAG: hypothetical protein ACJAQU_000952 [Loktanella salsilacus]|jgi:hypothetical protein